MDDVLQFLLAVPVPAIGWEANPLTPSSGMGGVYVPVRISGTNFRCESHERHFEATLTMSERADAKVECPTCGTAKVHPSSHSVHREDLAEELTTKGLWADSLG